MHSPLTTSDPAAHASLRNPVGSARLLDALRTADVAEQVASLTTRLPEVGLFGLFFEQQGSQDRFRFGREADGGPARPWAGTT